MNLHGPVRAADSAAPGKAQLTISFDAWKDGQVRPTSHTVEVLAAKAGPKPEPVSHRLVRTLIHPDRRASISLLRFSDDGRRLAAAGYPSGVLQIWDPATGQELSRVETPAGYRGTSDYISLTADWKTAFTPYDGRKTVRIETGGEKRYVTKYAGGVSVWDVASGKRRPPIKLAPERGALTAFVSPDGSKLITMEAKSYDPKGARFVPHTFVFRDLARPREPVELTATFAMAAFAPDGRTFVLASGDRESKTPAFLRLFDSQSAELLATLAEEPNVNIYFPAFSADGKRVVAEVRTGDSASVIKVWDLASQKESAALRPPEPALALYPAFSADGRFVTASRDEAGYVWDVATAKVVLTHRFGTKGFTRGMAISPDGRRAAVVGTPGIRTSELGRDPDPADLPQPRVVLYDLASGKAIETLICPSGFPGKAVFSPDGKTLAVGGSGKVLLFDLAR